MGQHQSAEVRLPSSDQEEGQPKVFDADEEEDLAEAEQEDGQDVQEDVGEGEAAEEEGEVREVAQEDQEASPMKRSLPSRRLVSSSSSMPLSLASAISALSTALLSSASCTPSFLLNSSSFCSLSEAILTVALRFLSSSSMVTSLLRQVFSTTLMVLSTLSAALEVMPSLVTVWHSCSAAFLSSSSMSMILLVRAETSLSTSLNCFSASSRDSVALVSLSLVSSKPISSCCTFLP